MQPSFLYLDNNHRNLKKRDAPIYLITPIYFGDSRFKLEPIREQYS